MSSSGDLDLISAINVTPSEIIDVVSKPVYLVLGAISTISNLMIQMTVRSGISCFLPIFVVM